MLSLGFSVITKFIFWKFIDTKNNANISYNSIDFKFPYDGTDTANNHYLPNTCSAPFVELYTEGISNFEPIGQSPNRDTTSGVACRNTAKNGGLPFSSSFTANFFSIAANYPYSFSQDISAEKTFIFFTKLWWYTGCKSKSN